MDLPDGRSGRSGIDDSIIKRPIRAYVRPAMGGRMGGVNQRANSTVCGSVNPSVFTGRLRWCLFLYRNGI